MLRFSISPVRDMDINDLRIALFNYIVSKQKSEDFVIRIEDIEREKNIEGKDAEIIALLDLFGIQYRDVLYQSKNFKFHQAMAVDLLHRKKAFNCFCDIKDFDAKYDGTCENLPAQEVIDNPKPFCVRIKKPLSPIVLNDIIKGKLEFTPEEIDSFVLLKKDKIPTYNFACGVDDMLSDISMVICTEKHLIDTSKQIYLRRELGYDKEIEYAHLVAVLAQNTDHLNIKWLLEEGFLPEAISNYLISIGNNLPKDIFTIDEVVEWLNLEKLSKTPVAFDMDTLRYINREHLKTLDNKELSRYVGFADAEVGKLAKLYLEEVSTTKELKEKISPVFQPKEIPEKFSDSAEILKKIIQEAPYFDKFDEFKTYLIERSNLEEEKFLKSFRYLLTGEENGPEIKDIYEAIKNYIKEIVK